jgi:glycosyltransferase involved in cell wall biosynthesis
MSSVKKLCIATGIFPPDKGGPAQFSSSFSSWLSRHGINSKVLSLTDDRSTKKREGLVEIDLISRRIPTPLRLLVTATRLVKISRTHKLLVNGLFLETFIASIFRRFEYSAKIPGDIVWERARNKGLTSLSIEDFQNHIPKRHWLMRWAFTKSLSRAAKVIAPSLYLRDLMITWGVEPSKIVVIPNSVDTDLFTPKSSSKKLFDFVTVCRLVPWKGVAEVIDTCAKTKSSLLIVGSGPQEEELRKHAAKLGVVTKFAGEVSQEELPGVLASARYFVLNSSYEGSPHALIEAMACGMTVVARENTGTAELISSGKTGLLVGKARALNDAFCLLLNGEVDSESLGKAARSLVLSNYGREAIFTKIKDLVSL